METETEILKPEGLTDEHLNYLDVLRESGVTNMFGSGQYLVSMFEISKRTAAEYVKYWMKTFSARHNKGQ